MPNGINPRQSSLPYLHSCEHSFKPSQGSFDYPIEPGHKGSRLPIQLEKVESPNTVPRPRHMQDMKETVTPVLQVTHGHGSVMVVSSKSQGQGYVFRSHMCMVDSCH